ncbi:class I SAM-dependent methyltransferase [Nostoc cycadae]|uniref:Methyltransferase type 11 domain-containing protein n=1 Tax=Nostoc cycadae WK-1 TaxID=1861711 RepID=A0A2H6LQ54_9NOSO|nr:class I SAM-dependent methyltransferase [Nostoc cycadae]GBE95324.1 hypothetical protein NCWK1_5110 [Nostoc cycadae WK-1]
MDLNNTQCPSCNQSALTTRIDQYDNKQIYIDAITCNNCGKNYDLIWGVPYLGIFKQEEILSLFEIAANAAQYQVKEKNADHNYLNVISMVNEYTNSCNKVAVLSKYGLTNIPYWLEYRYNEHLFFKTLTQAIDLRNKCVLDIGAGSGYDSLKFYSAGATVTCLEFSPALSAFGNAEYPQLRWFGGSSDNLPFADCQFDIVTANAALHHLVDIPKSLQESLRVLKPGGYLITLGDSFMADSSTEEEEALIFNHHTSVLQGINEQVPKFQLFTEIFKYYKDALDIRVFTQNLYGLMPYHSEWSFEEAITKFPQLAGSINFLIQKKQHISIPQSSLSQEAIRPSEYAKDLYNPDLGIHRLIDLIADQFVNLSVTDQSYPKFRLLNGWKLPQAGENKRTVYKRARLFFSLDRLKDFLHLSLLIPYVSNYDSPTITIKLNSINVFSEELVRGVWHELYIPMLVEVHTHKNFLVEVQLQSHNSSEAAQEFYIRDLEFLPEASPSNLFALEHFGLETLIFTHFKGKHSVTVLISPDFEHNMDVINRLRKWQLNLQLIVPSWQDFFYSWIPECEIVETYPNFISDPTSIDNYHIQKPIQLVAASNSELKAVLQKIISVDLDQVYWIQSGGYSQLLASHTASITDGNLTEATAPLPIQQFSLSSTNQYSTHSKQLEQKVSYLEKQLQDAREEIAAMKTSKFWQLRGRWFRLKQMIGINHHK